jgi:putative ABC transport system permease protein
MAVDTPTRRAPDEAPRAAPRVRRPSLFREVGRNLRRRRLRSFLTLSGIALGAFALMVMGSLAENFNSQIGSLREFLAGQVMVRPKGSTVFWSSGNLPVTMVAELEQIEGVDVAVPNLEVQFEENPTQNFGPPLSINGVDIERAERSPLADLELASGRRVQVGERWKINLGSTLAGRVGETEGLGRPARPGDVVTIRGHQWEGVGIGRATGTPIDGFAVASIEDTRVIASDEDPFLNAEAVTGEIQVYPADGVDADELAERVEAVIGDRAIVFPPQASAEQIDRLSAIWSAIILGSALVALIVGGVAIINTMVFSVTERTREIGVKKAVGASSRDILREFLAEAAFLSVLGGILGGVVGYLFTRALNAASRAEGVIAFTVTPRLALFVLVLSIVIGAGAGFLPARRAARIDPVRALRTLG